jgi:Ni,Fe-hydrogenase III small subunit
MIFDVIVQSLKSSQVVVPLEKLLGTAEGSRMPDVRPDLLTPTIAAQVVSACPTGALSVSTGQSGVVLTLDYGECVGCGHCYSPSNGALFPARRISCCGTTRVGLVRHWDMQNRKELTTDQSPLEPTAREIRAILGRALNVRQLDAGSCNGCEAEISALSNPYYDLERFGIHFVASPKHADMLLVTGPVTRNMAEAVKLTYQATPSPKLVIAVGACGVGGGIFGGSHAVVGPVDAVIPVDAYIPGCPPTPAMLLTGILRALRLRKI